MRVAVIGSGVSGLTAAYVISRRHRVTLYEKDDRFGGHAHTVAVAGAHGEVGLDTGFIVHNERTYPHLLRLFRRAGRRNPGKRHVLRRALRAAAGWSTPARAGWPAWRHARRGCCIPSTCACWSR